MSTFSEYVESAKEDVFNKQRKIMKRFIDDEDVNFIGEIDDFTKIFLDSQKKIKENTFFEKDFCDFLNEVFNDIPNGTIYSLSILKTHSGKKSWDYMAPEITKQFYANISIIKAWLEKFKEDGYI